MPLGIRDIFAIESKVNPIFEIDFLLATTITNTSYSRKLLNLAKIYIIKTKYSNQNNSFMFKLAIFYDIFAKANILSKTKMKAFPTILKGLALDYYYLNISISGIG